MRVDIGSPEMASSPADNIDNFAGLESLFEIFNFVAEDPEMSCTNPAIFVLFELEDAHEKSPLSRISAYRES